MFNTKVVATANSTSVFGPAFTSGRHAGKRYVSVDIVLPWRDITERAAPRASRGSKRNAEAATGEEKLAA